MGSRFLGLLAVVSCLCSCTASAGPECLHTSSEACMMQDDEGSVDCVSLLQRVERWDNAPAHELPTGTGGDGQNGSFMSPRSLPMAGRERWCSCGGLSMSWCFSSPEQLLSLLFFVSLVLPQQ
eukprot:TRINITY_DN15457_c0_g1_i2.p2 TRINITY_DN15457_c0_g1~~TRINITY_DN15457_c0_g1_i2.p2  ORF type:complete len:123 (-),score=19.20 TRINITY_DN15457_c0_g1_i2:31-399(-)